MIFITGPMFSGKRDAARQLLNCSDAELAARCVFEAQDLAADCEDLETMADELSRFGAGRRCALISPCRPSCAARGCACSPR